ncbi:MAG: phage prohead protease HK97 family [Bacillota bacterium]|nr:MAG: phage prohead protease HK97 family [Bacillota bacterium]MBS3949945.1 HK97 family phage prohead protease [Peptococcaceae bacterium]
MSKLERRAYTLDFEVRGENEPAIVGYAAVINSLSQEMWGFREVIRPGAFSKAIGKDDVRALWNHDLNFVLGRNKAGTLRLSEDAKGLRVEITPPDATRVRDLLLSMRRGGC